VAGPDGALWFAEYSGVGIGRITVDGRISECPIPTPDSAPMEITVGPDGNLWFTESSSGKIGRLIP
jgi:virginiamycin B lyase